MCTCNLLISAIRLETVLVWQLAASSLRELNVDHSVKRLSLVALICLSEP